MAISSYFTLSYSSSAQLSRNLIPMKIKTRERRWEAKLNVGVESRVQSVDWIFIANFALLSYSITMGKLNALRAGGPECLRAEVDPS